MNKNNLELKRANGNLYLNFWDEQHGEDVVWTLYPSGDIWCEDSVSTREITDNIFNEFVKLMKHIESEEPK